MWVWPSLKLLSIRGPCHFCLHIALPTSMVLMSECPEEFSLTLNHTRHWPSQETFGLTCSLRNLWFTHRSITRGKNTFLIICSHTLLHPVFLKSGLPSLMSHLLFLQSKQSGLAASCKNIFSSTHLRLSSLHLPGCVISYSLFMAGYIS